MSTYNRVIRKLVVGFGNLFDSITLYRFKPDLTESERFIVPIAYASKERYVMRLEEDLNLDKKVQLTLPRMSFEMAGLSYDSSRKQNTNIKNFAGTPPSGVLSQYNPVPYNFDFNLYIYVRNIEDGTQIIEHILPFFAPDYTIKLNLIPEMGIVKEIPVVLNSTTHDIVYEGDKESETRMIIWTLSFTVKGYVFGKTTPTGQIRTSITNIFNDISSTDVVQFNMANTGTGTYQTGEIVYQGYSAQESTASGRVVLWTNNILHLTNIQGNFVSDARIIGTKTNSNYQFTSYVAPAQKMATITVVPNPTTANTANANVDYTYTTTITEFPNTI